LKRLVNGSAPGTERGVYSRSLEESAPEAEREESTLGELKKESTLGAESGFCSRN
jgi:hypothetical protein